MSPDRTTSRIAADRLIERSRIQASARREATTAAEHQAVVLLRHAWEARTTEDLLFVIDATITGLDAIRRSLTEPSPPPPKGDA